MRGQGAVRAACRLLPACSALAAAVLLGGCQDPRDAPVGDAGPTAARLPGHGPQFLAVGACSSFGTAAVTEVPCPSERAAARVVARYDGAAADGPLCPPLTDFVLHIGAQRAAGDADGDEDPGAIPPGYACMRDLEPPHPGDPGAGGGPRTIPGDCVGDVGGGRVRETPCDGSGPRAPRYEVTAAVTARSACPASTVLYVQLGGGEPVGCARRL